MLEDVLQQRFAALQKRDADGWYSVLRQEAWDAWCKHYSVMDLPENWRAELQRAASPSLATKAALKAALDARHMWRRLATQAEAQKITQDVAFIGETTQTTSVQKFLRQRLVQGASSQHALALLQLALLSEVWWVRAASGAHFSSPLQPPPGVEVWDEMFSLHVIDVASGAQIEVVSGCMAPKGARAQGVYVEVGAGAHLTWTSMGHAPSSEAEVGVRHVVLRGQAQCIWRDVRLNAGSGLSTHLDSESDAALTYQGLWAAPLQSSATQVLDWLQHRSELWLLGDIEVPSVPQAKSFRMPKNDWAWRTVHVPDDAWRQFCVEQFLLPFLRNLPVEYQTDIVRFAELSVRKSD